MNNRLSPVRGRHSTLLVSCRKAPDFGLAQSMSPGTRQSTLRFTPPLHAAINRARDELGVDWCLDRQSLSLLNMAQWVKLRFLN